jgi:beta-galactosidase
MKLGVCYYPEHWPDTQWADDAARMAAMGIRHVRIAEFAWSRIEPTPGQLEWAWLDRAIATLHAAGLEVVMCTPTATPPKWLIDAHPEVLAHDLQGRPRGFGSRRHYCFSSPVYREQSRRISRLVAERYGQHPAVTAWQTDNEYGCHDTVLSTSPSAVLGFRRWLERRYGSVDALNKAWGNVFWSMEVTRFDQIDLPALTVTEANPSHRLDWRRFASDEVVAFNREQVQILRECSPGRPVSHNFMGFFTEFNHHDVAADLDIATWDSYPLGFTQMFFLSADEKVRWARTGHPDIPGFHHDLYRGMCLDAEGRGRWWVMEQQPGPVNWAHWNPTPLDGMVRLWTWQAFAHGAEVVSYFRWRQAPMAQEQMHAGLLRPDSQEAQGAVEAAQVGAELRDLHRQMPLLGSTELTVNARVALVFDYESLWMSQIQPQGQDYNALELCFRWYSALRQLGLDVDIVSPRAALGRYALIVLPAQLHVPDDLLQRLRQSSAQIVLGPRAGSKTQDLHIPAELPPGPLSELAGTCVVRVASTPPGYADTVVWPDGPITTSGRWREELQLQGAMAEATFADDGRAAVTRHGSVRQVAAWLDADGLQRVLRRAALDASLPVIDGLPDTVRVSRIGNLTIVCNFAPTQPAWRPADAEAMLLGNMSTAPFGVEIWKH